MSSTANDQCEHCHSAYSFIKKKKSCAVCHQSYCSNCAPRERNQSYRVCLICQKISSESTTDSQLLELKVKHLRSYLQAKGIPQHTCTEKQELVNLITGNRDRPFTDLSAQSTASESNNANQQASQRTSSSSSASMQPPKSDSSSKPFSNLQNTVSSLANQVNHFATNLQDYVTNTVSSAINQIDGDSPPQSPTARNHTPNGASFSAGTANNRPFNFSSPPPTGSTHTTTTSTANNARTSSQQSQARSSRPTAAATASSTSNSSQRPRRKSLSEINNEENIEDLNIRDLKEILAANFVDFKGCVEKSELLDKVRRLYRDRLNEKLRAQELNGSTAGDNESCKICMDAVADCVFLDCGHMVTCVKCGKLLAECPICRSNIVRVVRVFKS